MAKASQDLTGREYLRVSLDRDGKQKSVGDQHDENVECADDHGVTLGEPYAENGSASASQFARKARGGYDGLLADVRAGRFGADVLQLWEPSRGSRQVPEWCELLDALTAQRIRVLVTTDDRLYDPSRPADRKTLLTYAVDSEYETGRMSVRLRKGQAGAARQGKPAGRAPFGYERRYRIDENGRRVLDGQYPVPEQADVVREIYRRIGERESMISIAKDLAERGVPGVKWTPTRVRDLALTATYAGLREHVPGRHEYSSAKDWRQAASYYPGTWEPIIDKATWYATREFLMDPSRRKSRPGRQRHLLSMIAECGVCSDVLTVRYDRDRPAYVCRQGGHVWTGRDELDHYVSELVIGRLSQDDVWADLAPRVDDAELATARERLAEIRQHHRELKDALRKRTITVATFSEVEPDVLADTEAAERLVRDLEAPPALRTLLGEPGQDMRTRWEHAEVAARRDVIRLLFDSIRVGRTTDRHPNHVAERTTIAWRTEP